MMKKTIRRWAAAALSLLLAVTYSAPALAAGSVSPVSDGVTPTVDEAYYATLDYYGNLTEGSIVKSYVLNGATSITDYGKYDTVSNLTDGTTPALTATQTAFTFASDAAPTHFYFQGETAQPFEELPWTLSINYKLNGVATKAEDLAGKTGVVEIDVDAIPNANASEYARHNYTLEAMALFNQDDILSLEAPGGQVQLLGNLRAVLFLGFPGEEGHYTIRVGADSFEFGGMTFLMVPATLSQLDEITKLAERKEDLEDNYKKLSDSINDLLDSLQDISDSLYESANGLDKLNSARGTVSAGKGKVYAAADKALADLDELSDALAPLSAELGAANDALTEANGVIRELTETTASMRGDLDTLDAILKNTQGSKEDLLQAINDLAAMQPKLKSLAAALSNTTVPTLSTVSGLSGLSAGTETASLTEQLSTAKSVYALYTGFGGSASGITEAGFMQAAMAASGKYTAATASDAYSSMAATYGKLKDGTKVGETEVKGIGENATQEEAKKAAIEIVKATATQAVQEKQSEITAAVTAQYQALVTAGQMTQEQEAAAIPAAVQAEMKKQVQAAVEANASKIADMVTAYVTYQTLDSCYNAAKTKYGSVNFEGFVYALQLANGAAPTAAAETAEKAANVISANADGSIDLLASEAETISDSINQSIGQTVTEVNSTISSVNDSINAANASLSTVGALTAPTANLLTSLSTLCDDVVALKPLVEDVDDLGDLAREDIPKLQTMLDEVAALQKVLDDYEPEANRTVRELQTAANGISVTLKDTSAFLRSAEGLVKNAGSQLDAAAEQSLSSLAGALRSAGGALDQSGSLRDVKDTISDLIEQTWNDYTGDVMDLLDIDAAAEAVSLTDPRNPAPASVQVLIRTREIKVSDSQPTLVSAEGSTRTSSSDDAKPTTFWSRVGAMFSGVWTAIVGIFRK